MVLQKVHRTNCSVWQNPNGNRNVPYLNNWNDKRNLNLNWYDNDWNDNYRFLAVRKTDHLVSCLIHPPINFPISIRRMEIAAYFLASRTFISQQILSISFRLSKRLLAKLTLSNLFLALEQFAENSPPINSKNKLSIFAPKVQREVFGICSKKLCQIL